MRIDFERLHRFVVSVFTAVGVPEEHAATTASRLLEADLRGRHGHGLIRVPQYVPRIEQRGINPTPDVTVRRSTPVSALVDGDNGLGQVVMTRATEEAIRKAEENGTAWVGTTHSNHAGAAGVYTGMALKRELIAIYLAVASANVMPPWGGSDRLLGTNPISIAIPAGEEPAFQLDIATTVTSHGTIQTFAQRGEQLPVGWVQDAGGIQSPTRRTRTRGSSSRSGATRARDWRWRSGCWRVCSTPPRSAATSWTIGRLPMPRPTPVR
jgi:LDH2 family malate/lactate/ureidoglycolate dehydrogenase